MKDVAEGVAVISIFFFILICLYLCMYLIIFYPFFPFPHHFM